MTKRRRIHSRPSNGATNEWLTPPQIVDALGSFDLDPCAHPHQPNRTADVMLCPPTDGLSAMWEGRVFLNPPYGQSLTKWIKKLSQHGNGIALVPSRTEVEKWFWPYIWERASAIFFFRGRLYFHYPNGKQAKGNAGHGSVLAAYGEANVDAIKSSGIAGKLIALSPSTPTTSRTEGGR